MGHLVTIECHGSRQSKATGWAFWPAFAIAVLDDGSRRFMGDISHDEVLTKLDGESVSTQAYRAKLATWEAAHSYPAKPENVELYWTGTNYEKPTQLFDWQWSTTFGRWGRLVTFAGGWHGFTYPKI